MFLRLLLDPSRLLHLLDPRDPLPLVVAPLRQQLPPDRGLEPPGAVLVHLPVLDQQHVEVELAPVRDAAVQVLVRLVPGRALRDPPEAHRDLPHVRVHGEVRAQEAEHQHAAHGLGPDALESRQLALHLLVGRVAQVFGARRLAALRDEGVQDGADPGHLDLGQPAALHRRLHLPRVRGSHGGPGRERALQVGEGHRARRVGGVLAEDRADERVEHGLARGGGGGGPGRRGRGRAVEDRVRGRGERRGGGGVGVRGEREGSIVRECVPGAEAVPAILLRGFLVLEERGVELREGVARGPALLGGRPEHVGIRRAREGPSGSGGGEGPGGGGDQRERVGRGRRDGRAAGGGPRRGRGLGLHDLRPRPGLILHAAGLLRRGERGGKSGRGARLALRGRHRERAIESVASDVGARFCVACCSRRSLRIVASRPKRNGIEGFFGPRRLCATATPERRHFPRAIAAGHLAIDRAPERFRASHFRVETSRASRTHSPTPAPPRAGRAR